MATGSSVYLDRIDDWDAGHAIDGLISEQSIGFFCTKHDLYAWLQLEFSTTLTVEHLSIVMRSDCCAERFSNVGIYVGNQPATYGKVSRNQRCTYYEGPAQLGETVELGCDTPVSGQYVIIQIVHLYSEHMQVNEVSVCGYEGRYIALLST